MKLHVKIMKVEKLGKRKCLIWNLKSEKQLSNSWEKRGPGTASATWGRKNLDVLLFKELLWPGHSEEWVRMEQTEPGVPFSSPAFLKLSLQWQFRNFFFFSTGVWIQGYALSRQVTTWATPPVLFAFSYFSNSRVYAWSWPRSMILWLKPPELLGPQVFTNTPSLFVEIWFC
jgi:hypothetical protein